MKIKPIVSVVTFVVVCVVALVIYKNNSISNTTVVEDLNSEPVNSKPVMGEAIAGDDTSRDDVRDDHEDGDVGAPMAPEPYLLINIEGTTVHERFNTPINSQRTQVDSDSFAFYLRNLPLKAHSSKVLYYDGRVKSKSGVYEAVVDMELSPRDLQQCADAVMRLRGEYLYAQEAFNNIHFNLTNGFRMDYSKWMAGYRVVVEGNKTSWKKSATESNTHENFRKYIDFVFAYAGTLSLSQELEARAFSEMTIGDVLIKGGSPGHAVIVVDMAEDQDTGQRYFMLAQSYMPAQETQILVCPESDSSPWYKLDDSEVIRTPEWTFKRSELKTFGDR